jgi:acetate kinase
MMTRRSATGPGRSERVHSVLVVNAGSTSLKLHLVRPDESVDAIEDLGAVRSADVAAVAHRVVHGGQLVRPTVIDDEVRASIEELSTIAPLHNAPALAAIDRVRELFPAQPHVAVFDTAFHATMPAEASTYAIPRRWREEWGIRRYGFHGLSVEWSAERAVQLLGARSRRLVVCHLGGGCSVTAVLDGSSVDTTMGFTPLEGVPMATRSGSVDPGAVLYVQRAHGLSHEDVDRALNAESGLAGLAGGRDTRMLETAASRDETASLALRVYTYRIATAVAGMGAALGGLDAVAFTAGVGEHSPAVRAAICARLEFLGVGLDLELNGRATTDADIAREGSDVRVLVIAAREELVAARAARGLLRANT